MALHHHIKPHHHITIWIAAGSLVLSSAILASAAETNRILAQDTGPSEKTQQFFGFSNEKEQDFSTPAACQVANTEMQTLANQIQQYSSQLQSLSQQQPQPAASGSAEPTNPNETEIADLESKIQADQAQMKSLQTEMQTGPSDDCKKAIVAQAITQMSSMQDKMNKENKFFGTLDKVDQEITKVQNLVPALQAAGVPADKITKINSDIATVKAQEAILTSFFTKMKSWMASWIANAQADPLKAFADMQKGQGMSPSDAGSASKAADAMVNAFQDLVGIFDGLGSK